MHNSLLTDYKIWLEANTPSEARVTRDDVSGYKYKKEWAVWKTVSI